MFLPSRNILSAGKRLVTYLVTSCFTKTSWCKYVVFISWRYGSRVRRNDPIPFCLLWRARILALDLAPLIVTRQPLVSKPASPSALFTRQRHERRRVRRLFSARQEDQQQQQQQQQQQPQQHALDLPSRSGRNAGGVPRRRVYGVP